MIRRLRMTVAQLKKRMDGRFTRLERRMNARFSDVEHRMDARFNDVEHRMDVRFNDVEHRMDARFNDVEHRMDARFRDVDARFASLERLMMSLGDKFDSITRRLDTDVKGQRRMLDEHEERITDLERAERSRPQA